MYIAKFKVEKRESQKMYFSVPKQEVKKIQFKVEKREPIKFKVSSNFKLNVES